MLSVILAQLQSSPAVPAINVPWAVTEYHWALLPTIVGRAVLPNAFMKLVLPFVAEANSQPTTVRSSTTLSVVEPAVIQVMKFSCVVLLTNLTREIVALVASIANAFVMILVPAFTMTLSTVTLAAVM